MDKKETFRIPKLEIENFTFSPPGPMGWSFTEYENLLDNPDQLVLDETTVNGNLEELNQVGLVVLPAGTKGNKVVKSKKSEESQTIAEMDVESSNEQEKIIASNLYDESSEDEIEESVQAHETEEVDESVQAQEEEKNKSSIVIVEVNPPKPPWMATGVKEKDKKDKKDKKQKKKKKDKEEKKDQKDKRAKKDQKLEKKEKKKKKDKKEKKEKKKEKKKDKRKK